MSKPIVNVKQGKLEGAEKLTEKNKKYFSFQGIPYAEPPVGKLRFKSPVPVTPWNGIRDASKKGNIPAQTVFPKDDIITGNEDCLYLNVYTPSLPKITQNGSHSVMVFFHGGGFKYGSGDEEEFGPEYIIEKDIVLVVINYRLDVFGFLSLNSPDVPGNAGLKDQNLALRWVKENIQHFDGNSSNITVFGISAGSASIEYHMLSPMSVGLFHKAIMMSGSVLNPWSRNRQPERFVDILLNALNIEENDLESILNCLQNVATNDLLKAALKVMDEESTKAGTLYGFGPVVEKSFENVQSFLNEEPINLLKSGRFLKIPTITGICKNEGSMFSLMYGVKHVNKMNNFEYAEYMKSFDVQDVNEINKKMSSVYKMNDSSDEKRVDDFLSDLLFVSGINRSLIYRSKYNDLNFGYMFAYHGNLKFDYPVPDVFLNDTPHAAEWLYLTKDFDQVEENAANPQDLLMRDYLLEMWTCFAKTGIPTCDGSPVPVEWKPFTAQETKILRIDKELQMIPFPWTERMNLWESFYK